jgi:hypothetical protein
MRIALGLVSLLVVLAIILILFSVYEAPMLKQSKSTRQQAQQIAGRDEDNAPVTDAITLDEMDAAGKMEAAVVTDVLPGSTIQTHYGLQKGDVLLELGQVTIKGNLSSAGEAKDFLLYAYQRNEPVVVMRGNERLTLPIDPRNPMAVAAAQRAAASKSGAPGAATTPPALVVPDAAVDAGAQQPAAPKPAPKKPGGLEGQLEIIRNAGGGQSQEQQ